VQQTFAVPVRVSLLVAALLAACVTVAGAPAARTTPGALDQRLDRTFRIAGLVRDASTAMVVDLETGAVVFARNPDLSLEPASNEKLGVTYTALVELGANYRFPTQLLGEGHRVGDTWEGRFVLKGFGDPSLTSSGLQRLVNIVWRLGIRRVTGNVVGDASYFDSMRVATGWLASFAGIESPPLSALVVDRAARNGRLVADPALAAAARFDQLLRAKGIVARGAVTGAATRDAKTIATIDSDPLSRIVQFMDRYSDNFTAEMVLKAIGASVLGQGTTAAGASVVRRDLVSAGVPIQGVRVVDGSGLSRDDRVTASELTSLLLAMWKNPTMRQIVWKALPVAGQSGTLEYRLAGKPGRSLLRAKTGTTDIASALSGYVGREFAFVAIENGHPVNYTAAHSAEDGVAEALIDAVEAR
jgi:D-alanyl-D-alanine carboxypeptidase/D-alanyl-D-alanine-endopeptidase (penicillin-binding protein 4)